MHGSKRWCILTVLLTVLVLLICGGTTAIVDPFFHYHGPLKSLQYPMDAPRYQNDGILKNFSYDAVITGSSMTENFRTSELDALFDVNSVKVPLSAGSMREVSDQLQRAIVANPDIKMILRSLDLYMLLWDKDYVRDFDYPDYLYDDNLLNDVNYLLNKDTFFNYTVQIFAYTRSGYTTPDFDTYCRWAESFSYGPEVVLRDFAREQWIAELPPLHPETEERLRENVMQNIVSLARSNPDIQFYYYFPPYNMVFWAEQPQKNARFLRAGEIAAEMMLECDNVHLFSFLDAYEWITDLNHYMDTQHHTSEINSLILQSVRKGEYRLTPDNNQMYWAELDAYIRTFDYDAFLEEQGYAAAEAGAE